MDIHEKFVYWSSKIEEQEPKLAYILGKIFNSVNMSVEFLKEEKFRKTEEINNIAKEYNVSNAFEDNAKVFMKLYNLLIESELFDFFPKRFEALERIRKTQYHIWNLFSEADDYNILVRAYNNRIEWPERKVIAKSGGFTKKTFIFDNSWYKNKKSVIILGVCGPSASGKSTVASLLKYSAQMSIINSDNFFRKFTSQKYRGYDNWEHEDSLMLDELNKCLVQLKNGEPALIPSKGWTEDFDTLIYPAPIIIVEGFLLFLNKNILSNLDYKIFIDLNEENQLTRRMKRDGSHAYPYITKVVIPHYRLYKSELEKKSDVIINGNDSKSEVRDNIKKLMTKWHLI